MISLLSQTLIPFSDKRFPSAKKLFNISLNELLTTHCCDKGFGIIIASLLNKIIVMLSTRAQEKYMEGLGW